METFDNILVPSSYVVPDWAVFTGLFLLFYLTIALSAYRKKIFDEFSAVFNANLTKRLFEVGNPEYHKFTMFLNLYFFLIAGVYLRYLNLEYGIARDIFHPVVMALTGAGAVLLIYLVKVILYRIVGFLARITKAISEYVFNFFFLHRFLALIFTPLVFVLLLVHPQWLTAVYIISGVIGTLWLIFLAFRLFFILQRNRVNPVFSFFFFIIIEILPLLLLGRWIYNLILKY